ncbi:hypothetical protein [Paenarthrobacter sp. NPDC018779]|uniref:hypothetical protein n=1 Tax=Paenarthrobacter sp. NPDC018779 TaxID=3364375 RepID=UPI0037C8874C
MNPAHELLELFEQWGEQPDGNPLKGRGFHKNEDEAVDDHLHAMCLLAAMKNCVDDLERGGYRVKSFRRSFRLWTKAVMNYPHAWNTNSNSAIFSVHAMDTLENLAAAIDGHLPTPTPERIAEIMSYLDDVVSLLGDDESLSPELRLHVSKIVQMIRGCIAEEKAFGETDLKQALYDLWVALYAAAGQSEGEEQRSRWTAMAEAIYKPAAAGFIGSIPGLAIGAAQLVQG